jgi:hypothetical protein
VKASAAVLAALASGLFAPGCGGQSELPPGCDSVLKGRQTLEELELGMRRGEPGPLTRNGLDAAWEDPERAEALCGA